MGVNSPSSQERQAAPGGKGRGRRGGQEERKRGPPREKIQSNSGQCVGVSLQCAVCNVYCIQLSV